MRFADSNRGGRGSEITKIVWTSYRVTRPWWFDTDLVCSFVCPILLAELPNRSQRNLASNNCGHPVLYG